MAEAFAYVYILVNRKDGTLYVGVTSVLVQRVYQHKVGAVDGFTKRYGIDRLVYFEPLGTYSLPSPARSRSRSGSVAGRSN